VSEPSTNRQSSASRVSDADAESRAWVEVCLDALVANAERLHRAAGPSTALLPMVKADAYGLGMVPVAKTLASGLAASALAGFGVAAVAEGEALRNAGWGGRIIVFSPVPPGEFGRAARADLTLCFSEVRAVERWAATAQLVGRRLAMHVEVDTGMGRAGFPWEGAGAWGPAVHRASAGRVEWQGTFSHFHSADEPDLRPTEAQWARFAEAVEVLQRRMGERPGHVYHVANSAASVRCDFRGEWVRPGIFLYGGRVGAEPPNPVVSVRARLALVRDVPPGTTLGYGATYVSRRPERWGTLGIGYGDGLRRALGPAGAFALVHGRRAPIIGRISMDMTVVDLTEIPGAAVGDVATLLGRDGEAEILLDEVAAMAGTISYEILTGFTPRLPRVYRGSRAGAVSAVWPPAPESDWAGEG
jgi:alanine racemase